MKRSAVLLLVVALGFCCLVPCGRAQNYDDIGAPAYGAPDVGTVDPTLPSQVHTDLQNIESIVPSVAAGKVSVDGAILSLIDYCTRYQDAELSLRSAIAGAVMRSAGKLLRLYPNQSVNVAKVLYHVSNLFGGEPSQSATLLVQGLQVKVAAISTLDPE